MDITLSKLDSYLDWCERAITEIQSRVNLGTSLETQIQEGRTFEDIPLNGQFYNFREVTIEPSLNGLSEYLHALQGDRPAAPTVAEPEV